MSFCETMSGGPGPVILTMGVIDDGSPLVRDGSVVRAAKPVPIGASAFTWNTTDLELWIAYSAGVCTITLPASTDVTSWVPGQPGLLRTIRKYNASANGIILTPQAGCTINGGAAAASMNPIPGTAVTPSLTVLMPSVRILRASATAFIVFSGA